MAQLHINVTTDAVRALRNMSAALYELNDQMRFSLQVLHSTFEENAAGLGAHTAEIERLLDELNELAVEAAENNQKLAKKASRAATLRCGLIEESPYRTTRPPSNDQYVPDELANLYDELGQQGIHPTQLGPSKETMASKYVKTTYSGTVSYTVPKTKQRVTKLSTRDVYENSSIDPAMLIPAGTKYLNGHSVKADTTNLALMKEGKAPFIAVTDANNSVTLVPVELHHLSAEETRHGSAYFTGFEQDGSLIEIAATVHDDYSRQLHIGGPSFRRDVENNKTEDAAKYDSFRSTYWKHRAEKFLQKK